MCVGFGGGYGTCVCLIWSAEEGAHVGKKWNISTIFHLCSLTNAAHLLLWHSLIQLVSLAPKQKITTKHVVTWPPNSLVSQSAPLVRSSVLNSM